MTGIAPDVPQIPQGALDFAKAVGELAKVHGIQDATIEMRIDTGFGSKYHDQNVQQKLTAHISMKDGRGRPRQQIWVLCDMQIRSDIVMEPNSTN